MAKIDEALECWNKQVTLSIQFLIDRFKVI
jgi:hypothetical protein